MRDRPAAETALPISALGRAGRPRRLALLAALYVSQAIPLGFFIEGVPAIGRDIGLSLRDIGLVQALAAPFMLKFLWAPLVDGWGSSRRGHYRSWLLPLQGLAVISVVAIALLDPRSQAGLLLPLAGLFMLLAATQDIASDGMAVHILPRSERGLGNGIQVGGFYLGQILGGGAILLFYARFGWRPALLAMAAMLAVPLANVLTFREPPRAFAVRRVQFGALGRFFRRPGILPWIVILLIYRSGDAMALTMAKPMLVDLGLSLSQIGLIAGVGNSSASLLGALAGGMAVERIGRKRSLVGFSILHGFAVLGFALPALGFGSLATIWMVSMGAAFAGGMATAALYTQMMDRASAETGGTDFTLQQSLAVVGPLVGAGISGLLAQALGYAPHFAICAGISLAAAVFVGVALRDVPGESTDGDAPGA
jgi:predicted MFS family arabinose efflux permease